MNLESECRSEVVCVGEVAIQKGLGGGSDATHSEITALCGSVVLENKSNIPDPKGWKWRCRADLWPLRVIMKKNGSCGYPVVDEWYHDVVRTWGEFTPDNASWPMLSCDAQFVLWRRGPPQAVEVKRPDGTWVAAVAERMPLELDDAIKGQCYQHWINAAGPVTPMSS